MSTPRPDIFRYQDYRSFLQDWFAFKKASQSAFSLRQIAKQAGLASGYLPMILNNKRPLSPTMLAKLMPHLGLNHSEQSFLENLLKLQTSGSNDVHVAALQRMQRFQNYQQNNPNEAEVYEYLTHWYYVAIRELASAPDFRPDPTWIQARLSYPVPLADVRSALEFLFSKGFLKQDKDGPVQPPEKSLNCNGEVFSVVLAKFHRQIFELAAQSIQQTPKDERNILGHTCALSSKNYEKAAKIVDEAIDKIRELGKNEKQSDSVYHMEIALFPLTRRNAVTHKAGGAKNKRGAK